jgi:hypothetical protein
MTTRIEIDIELPDNHALANATTLVVGNDYGELVVQRQPDGDTWKVVDDWTFTRTLWVLYEIGATFVFPRETDARQAALDEQNRGLHVQELVAIAAPVDDHATYAQAVAHDPASAHLHPTFTRADQGEYPVLSRERFCESPCSECEEVEAP